MPRNCGDREITPFNRGRIIGMFECGLSRRAIASKLNISVGCVQRWIRLFLDTGKCDIIGRSGSPKISTPRSLRVFSRNVRKNPKQTIMELSLSSGLSCRTTSRVLIELGFRKRVARRKLLLSRRNIQKRLRWARSFKDEPAEFWRNIVFTDEARFEQISTGRHSLVWRVAGEELSDNLIEKTVKHGGCSVMVWGAVWYSGRSELVFVNGTLNSVGYIGILRKNLMPLYDRGSLLLGTNQLQEDFSPCHASRRTAKWKARKNSDVFIGPPKAQT